MAAVFRGIAVQNHPIFARERFHGIVVVRQGRMEIEHENQSPPFKGQDFVFKMISRQEAKTGSLEKPVFFGQVDHVTIEKA